MFFDSADLIDRLCSVSSTKDRRIILLVGSALSLPDEGSSYGVPGVSAMVELVCRELGPNSEAVSELRRRLGEDPANRYRRAFEFLLGRRGQDAVNRVVRTAVWRALDLRKWPTNIPKSTPEDADEGICKALESDVDAWVLPRAMELLGRLLVRFPDTFGSTVLTTNFDPMIEISVSKQGGRPYGTVLHTDGDIERIVADGIHIVHLHGYWYGFDTLHSPHQLVQSRVQLKRSLERLLEASALCVIGYSGWDDVVARTLVDTLSDSGSNPEVMWAFHEDDEAVIETEHSRLISNLQPGLGRGRVSLYRGVECGTLLREAERKLTIDRRDNSEQVIDARNVGPGSSAGDRTVILVDDGRPVEGANVQGWSSSEADSPLFVEPWVGRDQELSILASSNNPVAFITGIGGQGKSALAGRFLQVHATTVGGRFEFWDWRDCREESDRLATQLLRVVRRLGLGALELSEIEVNNVRAVVSILFGLLGDRRGLFVFDNVDQYIDLENLTPVRGLEVLISEAQARRHKSVFLFTCRPDVRVDEARTVRIALSGLTIDETRALLHARGMLPKDQGLVHELHTTTDGHALWISLVAMQAARHDRGLRGTLEEIRQGGAKLPETTRTIWRMLNDQQREVLRTMAELDRPESQNRLLDLLPGLNANRVNRALKALQSFHLIETRTQPGRKQLLGLHPIIREFIRTSFPTTDRETYAVRVLGFLEKMIGSFKDLLWKDPSYGILEHWIRKADLNISFGHYPEATSTIAEIAQPLINRGYTEELIRLTRRLLDECDWAEACSSYTEFDTVFDNCVTQMVEVGHFAIEQLLTDYERAIPGRSSQFILLCNLRCYASWFTKDFDSAIHWGELGERLKRVSSVDTRHSTVHNLALARRDKGLISQAIEGFLDGEYLDKVVGIGETIDVREHHFYGNIGRCLFLEQKLDKSRVCYIKSARLLEASGANRNRLNKGYIRWWFGELFVREGSFKLAALSYRAAVCMWMDSSPPRTIEVDAQLSALVADHPTLKIYLDMEDWRVEGEFCRWLDEQVA